MSLRLAVSIGQNAQRYRYDRSRLRPIGLSCAALWANPQNLVSKRPVCLVILLTLSQLGLSLRTRGNAGFVNHTQTEFSIWLAPKYRVTKPCLPT